MSMRALGAAVKIVGRRTARRYLPIGIVASALAAFVRAGGRPSPRARKTPYRREDHAKNVLRALFAGLVLAGSMTGTSEATSPASVAWAACGEYGGECATIKVPLDYADPSGPTLDLAIGRLKALNPAKRIGVLVVHPGGPGASGINPFILGNAIPAESALRQYFDLVSLDPRGVGRSSPIQCSVDVLDQMPATYPADEAEYQTWVAYNAKLSKDCREHSGAIFDHVDTTSATRDVDSLRAALGERKISFFAISYGTQVGQQYAELFPGRLRALAIDSNMDHSMTSALRYLQTTTEDFEGSFRAFAQWCGTTAACPLHGRDVSAVWDSLHDKAAAGTLTDPGSGLPIQAEQLRVQLFDAMQDPAGDWFAIAAYLKGLADGQAAPAPAKAATATGESANYAYPVIWCSDWKWQVSGFKQLDDYRKRLEATAPHTKLSPFWSDVISCLGWQGEVTNPQHRLDVSGAPPVLLPKSRYDVGTPAAWNYAVATQLPKTRVLEYTGVGHGQYRNSLCAREHIEKYLTSLVLPPAGTRCAPEYPSQPATALKAGEPNPLSVTGRPLH
ncbi:alpha/beta fold hydrolase [Nonomuraea sp. NPDC050783]|uniref:alpha/beta fold hydrolase n=1 Tax=Nonomuraea sp. NPDC050783 TaxID=3154634 RepID=UPI0034661D5A